jgi:hypothetical protein
MKQALKIILPGALVAFGVFVALTEIRLALVGF